MKEEEKKIISKIENRRVLGITIWVEYKEGMDKIIEMSLARMNEIRRTTSSNMVQFDDETQDDDEESVNRMIEEVKEEEKEQIKELQDLRL